MGVCIAGHDVDYGIGERIDGGAECTVYKTRNPFIVLKLYNFSFERWQVETIIALNKKYTERGLAPKVYSDVLEVIIDTDQSRPADIRYGYYAEAVTPVWDSPDNDEEATQHLADCLLVVNSAELHCNAGRTRDGRVVLFDFGLFTLEILGLYNE